MNAKSKMEAQKEGPDRRRSHVVGALPLGRSDWLALR